MITPHEIKQVERARWPYTTIDSVMRPLDRLHTVAPDAPVAYAFALGALEHYAADNTGHPSATNRAVPIYYPKLRAKYGDVVTYEQNKAAHSQTELGFDVVEVAAKAYAKLLEKLAKDDFRGVTPELRANIPAFYADTDLPIATKKDKSKWKATMRRLGILKAAATH